MCIHTHIFTYKYACTSMYIHIYVADFHMDMTAIGFSPNDFLHFFRVHIHLHIYIHTYILMYICTHTYSGVEFQTTNSNTYAYTCIHVYAFFFELRRFGVSKTNSYIHTHMGMRLHTRIEMHVHNHEHLHEFLRIHVHNRPT